MDVNLSNYRTVLLNSSGGKDSQAMIDYVAQKAREQNAMDRVVVVHADLGRVEWPGTKELAKRQAEHYGFRFEVVTRTQGDLLTQVEQRGMWPSSTARYCTSDHKRAQVAKVITKLSNEHHAKGWMYPRILNCLGLRAQESPARQKKQAFVLNSASNGKRGVDLWLPIHDWTVDQVWARIKASGVEHHKAYDLGMSRLSCCFCIFAPKAGLMLAGKHNPELLNEYVDLERKMGHTFRKGFAIAEVKASLDAGETCGAVPDWNM